MDIKFIEKFTKNDIEKFLKNNWLYIVWFIVNFTVCWTMFGGGVSFFFILLLVYAVSIFIALSPVGEYLLRLIESARPVLTKQELEYLTPIYLDVYKTVKAQNPSMGKVWLFLQDTISVNAFAIGRHTVVLTKGAIETFSEEELKGVLAHELGHIANGDTIAVLLNTIGNGLFAVIVGIIRLYILLIDILLGIFERVGILRWLLLFSKYIYEMLIMLFLFIGQAILSVNSRKSEFKADRFAYDNGYGNELTQALYLLQKMSLSEKMTIKERLQASHPIFAWRINKLETLIDGEG